MEIEDEEHYIPRLPIIRSLGFLTLEQSGNTGIPSTTWHINPPFRFVRAMQIRALKFQNFSPDPSAAYMYATSDLLAARQSYPLSNLGGQKQTSIVWQQPCNPIPPLSDQLPAPWFFFRDLIEFSSITLNVYNDYGVWEGSTEDRRIIWEIRLLMEIY